MLRAKKIKKPDFFTLPFYGYPIKKKQKKKNYYLKLNHINEIIRYISKVNKNQMDEFISPQITKQPLENKSPKNVSKEQKLKQKMKQKQKQKQKMPGFVTTPETEKQNIQNNKCMLKKINGELQELNNLDTCKILKNYIPYTKTTKFNIFNNSKQRKHFSYNHYNLNNFDILPTIYQTQNSNTDLVKKCREASQNPITDLSKHCKCSKNQMKKIKEALNNDLYLNLPNRKNELSKYLAYPREKIQRTICSNKNAKKKITNSNRCLNKSQSMPFQVGSTHFQTRQPDPHKTTDWMGDHDKVQNSSHTNICIKPQKNATTTLINHSRNMLISKIKNTRNDFISLETKEKKLISTLPNLKHYFMSYDKLNKMQKISNDVHKNCNQTLIYPKNKLSEKKKNCENLNHNLAIQKFLYQTDRIKSIKKKKCIEKINKYKVIYKSDDFVSIYKNEKNKNIDNDTVDLASLLCTPGYVGNYLDKSNSTNNDIFDNKEKNKMSKTKLLQNEEPNLSFVKNNLQVPKYYNINNSLNIPKESQTSQKFNNQFLTKQNDDILQNMTKAINSSPTLNLDLQYITFFTELLKNKKKHIL
ncbi:hypothetical protein YYC_04350 [Plasmodium yoelii 17X]|uniref:Uncharacterized protein n=1 Tax=Plasmodium yoelii 17X TaxID=1323249 RepID=V7PGI2_PLAYE|nr:hypothetical protein YYC_04350 [Plasmodium yoelii 17X]